MPEILHQILMSQQMELAVRLIIAALLGGFIGYERERLSWAAGLRTHMLVCVGSCLVMIVSAYGFEELKSHPNIRFDPSRMAAQVVSGIGFLGAGAIMMRGEFVRGLTTAASLWTVSAVGLAVGGGMYIEASVATFVVLVILAVMKPISEQTRNSYHVVELHVKADHGSLTLQTLAEILGSKAKRIRQVISQHNTVDATLDDVIVSFPYLPPKDVAHLEEALRKASIVKDVRVVRA